MQVERHLLVTVVKSFALTLPVFSSDLGCLVVCFYLVFVKLIVDSSELIL